MAGVQLIAGLGNPGSEYAETRHNAGFRFLEALCQQYGCSLRTEARFSGRIGRCAISGNDVLLFAPTTYMNDSGIAVAKIARYHKLSVDGILIVHDDLDLPAGSARLKVGGGNGGHNGLGSIERALGSPAFVRLRLGIGRPPPGREIIGYVLGRAPSSEREALDLGIDRALMELPAVVDGRVQYAMNRLHTEPDRI
ncbi:MAG: aminoacyl-tRNA hydrolase [Acidiferrobacteraceae bacterium]